MEKSGGKRENSSDSNETAVTEVGKEGDKDDRRENSGNRKRGENRGTEQLHMALPGDITGAPTGKNFSD
jgi:hypothetical protein